MTDWQRIAEAFNAGAKCKRRKDARPRVQHEPGCTFIACDHERCVCAMTDPGDGPLSALLARWQAVHG
jgi:hypothetical protein